MLDEGACVVLCDIERVALKTAEQKLHARYGADAVARVWVDVTEEEAVDRLFIETAWRFASCALLGVGAGTGKG